MRVVIAEDNEDSRTLLQAILEGHGHAVASARNGQEALDMIRRDPPELVISDILMPESDGYSLCRALKSDPVLQRIPFIFYTATYTEPSDRQGALDMGADRFLIKPMEPDLLLAEIENTLAACAAGPAADLPLGDDTLLAHSEKHVAILVRKLSKKVEELDRERLRLQESEAKYRAYVDNSPLAIFMTDPDGGILEANPAAVALTGRPAGELPGRNLADLVLPDSRPQCAAGLAELRATGRTRFEASCAKPDAGEASIVLEAAAVGGKAIVFCTDLTQMKRAEAELARNAAEKEAMRREIHHRVKNNLQVICSLLRIQSLHIEDPALRDVFSESESRIHAMALVHNELYAYDELAGISMQEFAESLALRLASVHQSQVRITVDARDVTVSIAGSIPCGLLLNELLLNCLKHAFAPGDTGEVRVAMRREGAHVTLQVTDNGRGLPPDFDPAAAETLGLTLINTLVRQLKGTLRFEGNDGTVATVEFEEG